MPKFRPGQTVEFLDELVGWTPAQIDAVFYVRKSGATGYHIKYKSRSGRMLSRGDVPEEKLRPASARDEPGGGYRPPSSVT